MPNTSTWSTIGGDLRAVVTWIIDYLRKRLKRLDRDMTAFGYLGLTLVVIWFLGLLLFGVDAAGAKEAGLSFSAAGVIVGLLHRPIGWVMFNITRALHIEKLLYEGLRSVQAWYLGFGLVLIGGGCIYLIRYTAYYLTGY